MHSWKPEKGPLEKQNAFTTLKTELGKGLRSNIVKSVPIKRDYKS